MSGGPIVCPNLSTVEFIDMKTARYSSGANPVICAMILGMVAPLAMPEMIIGIKRSHRLGSNGIKTRARA